MAAPSNYYVNFATGNDYKGASFTDGAYTQSTKTLVKAGAFAASQVNHWLKLSGTNITTGYYKIATVTDADTVILATDAGTGDSTAVACTQHDGSTAKTWRSIQGALDLITRDAINGDQINLKSGTAQVNQAALSLTTYGTPTDPAPLIIKGYTTAANDGGKGEIDGGGLILFASSSIGPVYLTNLVMHTFGNNNFISFGGGVITNCEIHKGASSPSSKTVIVGINIEVIGCYLHDLGTSMTATSCFGAAYNRVYNDYRGIAAGNAAGGYVFRNLVVGCVDAGILLTEDAKYCEFNTVYCAAGATGKGINVVTASGLYGRYIVLNNLVAGYSGAGGKGINIEAAARVGLYGHNAFYNCATNLSNGGYIVDDLGNDATLAGDPFTDAANGDFSLKTGVAGAIDGAYPGAWPWLATTVDHADIGAVQNGAGAGGGRPAYGDRSGGKQ